MRGVVCALFYCLMCVIGVIDCLKNPIVRFPGKEPVLRFCYLFVHDYLISGLREILMCLLDVVAVCAFGVSNGK